MFGNLGERLALVIDADATGALRAIKKVGDESEAQFTKAKTSQEKWSKGLLTGGAVAIGVAAVIGKGLYSTVQAYQASEVASLKLENTMGHQPHLAGASAAAFDQLAMKIDRTTAVSHVQVTTSESMLGQFGLTQKQILTLIPLVVDYSVKTGTDMVAATKAVGKAVDGSAGGLAKQGIILDKSAYAADHYGTVVRALASKVGGFAAVEGKTLEGRLQILNHQWTDFKENVGHGVVDELHQLGREAGFLATGMGHLSTGTEQSIGRIGTIATVAVAAGGGVALLAGGVMRLGTAMLATEGEASLLGLTPIGAAAIGVGIAVGGLAAAYEVLSAHSRGVAAVSKEITQAMTTEGKSAEEAGKSILANWLAAHRDEADILHKAGVSVVEYYAAIRGDRGALDAVTGKLDAVTAAAYGTQQASGAGKAGFQQIAAGAVETESKVSKLKNQLGLQNQGMKDAKASAATLASSNSALAGSTNLVAAAATRAAAALKGQRSEEERLFEKNLDVRDSTRNVESAIVSQAQAAVDLKGKENDLAAAIKAHGVNSAEAQQAQRDLTLQLIATSQAGDDTIRSVQDLAVKEIGASNAADAATKHHDAYIGALVALAKQFPQLAGPINAYIAQLGGIPKTVTTSVTTTYQTVGAPAGVKRYATGGSIGAGQMGVVGDVNGQPGELIEGPAVVHNPGETARMLNALAGGGGGLATAVHIHLDGPVTIVANKPEELVAGLNEWCRRNGNLPKTIRLAPTA